MAAFYPSSNASANVPLYDAVGTTRKRERLEPPYQRSHPERLYKLRDVPLLLSFCSPGNNITAELLYGKRVKFHPSLAHT